MSREERMAMFPKGCRVRLSRYGISNGILRCADPSTYVGTVVGHGVRFETITVLRDGLTTSSNFHWSFWDRVDLPRSANCRRETSEESARRFLLLRERPTRRRPDVLPARTTRAPKIMPGPHIEEHW